MLEAGLDIRGAELDQPLSRILEQVDPVAVASDEAA
jgi:hypothetical protein